MKGACLTRLGSDEALLPFPDPPEATKQPAGDIHDDSTGGGNRPAPRQLHRRHRRRQRRRAHPRDVPDERRRLPRRRSSCCASTVSSRSGSRARPGGARTPRSRSSPPGSTVVRSPHSARLRSGGRGAWTRPTSSTPSRRLGRCWPSRRSGRSRRLEVYDPLVAKIEAVLEHRRMLVTVRTLVLHHVQDQITKLPVEIRDQLTTNGKIEGRSAPPRADRHLSRIDRWPARTGCRG